MKTPAISILTAAVLMLSAGAAHADDGKIQMRPYVNKAGASMFVTWNTTTGASNIYYWDRGAAKYVATEIGLPAAPLKKVVGKVMIEPYLNSYGVSMFLVWDTKSGDSVIYYWDKDAANYLPTDVALPRPPVK